jgi:cytochrome c-type biogenesis protein CcmE
MKKIYIVAIAMIAVAIVLLTSTAKEVSTYGTFVEASRTGEKVKIAGQLSKDKEMLYEPRKRPELF